MGDEVLKLAYGETKGTCHSLSRVVAGTEQTVLNLDITFDNPEIQAKCTEGTEDNRDLGGNNPKVLAKRLRVIDTAPILETLRGNQGNFHELKEDRAGQISCTLDSGDRLIFVPDHDPLPLDAEGNLDWSQVTAVKIVEIVDYH